MSPPPTTMTTTTTTKLLNLAFEYAQQTGTYARMVGVGWLPNHPSCQDDALDWGPFRPWTHLGPIGPGTIGVNLICRYFDVALIGGGA